MKSAQERYKIRKLRLKNKIRGNAERPRLSVFRSRSNIYAQIIVDDAGGKVLAEYSTLAKDIKGKGKGGNIAAAELVGVGIAKKSIDAGITKVVFDRGGWPYHGRIKALAESARKNGLSF